MKKYVTFLLSLVLMLNLTFTISAKGYTNNISSILKIKSSKGELLTVQSSLLSYNNKEYIKEQQDIAEKFFKYRFEIVNGNINANIEKYVKNKEIIDFEYGRAMIEKGVKEKCNDTFFNYSYEVRLTSSMEEGNTYVNNYTVYWKYFDNDGKAKVEDCDTYVICFSKMEQNQWMIKDVIYSEFVLSAFPDGIKTNDWDERLKQIDNSIKVPVMNQDEGKSIISPTYVPGDAYLSYDRNAAVQYALAHTENWQTCPHFGKTATDDQKRSCTATYSKLFTNYNTSTQSSDCANFVCQCIWKGFGGVEDSTSINNHKLPMHSVNWWADSTQAHANWCNNNLSSSVGWIPLSQGNYTNDTYGVQAIVYSNSSNMSVGDIIWGNSHAMIITKIENGDIYLSGHTRNNKDLPFSQVFPSGAQKFVKIIRLKYNSGVIY